MILEKTVKVKWWVNNRKHFESLGYVFTKYRDELEISIKHVLKGSGVKITAICQGCLRHRKISYQQYTDLCHECHHALRKTGQNNPKWKDGLSAKDREANWKTKKRQDWSSLVKARDCFTCQICKDKKGKNLVSHHLMAWSSFPELRFDIDNGVTLCNKCHNEFHKICGKGKNTKEQFEKFKYERLK